MLIGYISFIVFLVLSFYWINKSELFRIDNCSKSLLLCGYGIKFLAAIVLWVIYTHVYNDRVNSDIFKYFDDAAYIFDATHNQLVLRAQLIFGIEGISSISGHQTGVNFWDSDSEVFFNDNRTMIRMHLLLFHFSQGFYLLHLLFFAFLSFIGSFGLFKFFGHFSSLPSKLLLGISFLPPSLLFWSSAPLKESYLLFSLGLLLLGISYLLKQRSLKSIFYIVLGLFFLLTIKLYVLFSILPALLLMLLLQSEVIRIKPILILALALIITTLIFQDTVVDVLKNKQLNFKELAIKSQAKSSIPLASFSNLPELILIQPQAFFNVFIRPIWPTHRSLLTLIAALEHLFYLSILILPFLFKRKTTLKEQLLILYSVTFLIITAAIIGSTTPILGAIVRYKSPLIPFYLIIVFSFIDFSKLMPQKQ